MKKRVFVFRKFDEFSRILVANDCEVINLPLIETVPVKDLSDFEAKLAAIEDYDGVFITSAAAAEIFRAKITEKKSNYRGKIYILGKRSFENLKDANLDLRYEETANTAREMLEEITPEELKGKNFLFVRGEKSLRIVPEFLARTAMVEEVVVYETREVTVEPDELKNLREKFEKSEIAAACFFSPSAAESFIEQFGAEILHQTVIVTIGKTTAEFFERLNIQVNFVSSKAKAEDFAVGLVDYLKEDLPTKYAKETRKR